MLTIVHRNKVIRLLWGFYRNDLLIQDASDALYEYIRERKPEAKDVDKFISYLLLPNHRSELSFCLNYIFDYYRSKHGINYVYKTDPFGLQVNKEVFLIY